MLGRISKNKIKATHFVHEVILGSSFRADIEISNSERKSFTDINGTFFGKIAFGKINNSVKCGLTSLDKIDHKKFNLEINVHSRPSIEKEPKSIDEMFQSIDNFESIIKNEKHFSQHNQVYGVPIRFKLLPLAQYLELNIEKIYIKLSDIIINDFQEIIS